MERVEKTMKEMETREAAAESETLGDKALVNFMFFLLAKRKGTKRGKKTCLLHTLCFKFKDSAVSKTQNNSSFFPAPAPGVERSAENQAASSSAAAKAGARAGGVAAAAAPAAAAPAAAAPAASSAAAAAAAASPPMSSKLEAEDDPPLPSPSPSLAYPRMSPGSSVSVQSASEATRLWFPPREEAGAATADAEGEGEEEGGGAGRAGGGAREEAGEEGKDEG